MTPSTIPASAPRLFFTVEKPWLKPKPVSTTSPSASTPTAPPAVSIPAPVPYRRHIVDAYEIPAELREMNCWLAWRLKPKGTGKKPGKEPISPVTGGMTGWLDPANHGDFETARDYAEAHKMHGLGIVLMPGCGLAGGDLDHCIDPATGEVSEAARAILEEADTYSEISPGLSGIRFIARGRFGGYVGTNREAGIEFYEAGRFLTITGDHIEHTPFAIEERDLTALGKRYFDKKTTTPGGDDAGPWHPVDISSLQISDFTRNVITSGDVSAYGGDRSVALFGVAKDLIRAGLSDSDCARVLTDPRHGISSKALEERHGDVASAMDWVMKYTVLPARRKVLEEPPPVDFQEILINKDNAGGWPDPQPLTAKLDPEPYPLDALPGSIRAAVSEVASFVKAPVSLVASSCLGSLSLSCQAHVDVKRLERLSGPTGLFILVIADSGERKSTCDNFFTKTVTEYEEIQYEVAKPAIKNHKAASEAWEARRQGIKEKIRQLAKEQKQTAGMESVLRDLEHDKPEPPRIPRLLYADATPEALAYGLAKQWPSGGVVSAEAGIVFGSHGMGKDSIMRNLGLLNQLWDGKTLTIDRRSTESFTVRGARLTVALQVQEPTLREFFTRAGALARGSGFLARFLVAWPDSTQGMRQIDPDAPDGPATWPHLAAFHRRLAAILDQPVPIDDDGALTPALLALAPDAKAAWVDYHNDIESELSSGGELYDVRDVASKSADNAARLAALFQTFEGTGGSISLAAFEGASLITAWHLHEARRFFGELALPAELADAARLDTWLIEYCRRERTHLVSTREAQRLGPVRDKEKLGSSLRELVDLDRVRVSQEGRRKVIAVNPSLVGWNDEPAI